MRRAAQHLPVSRSVAVALPLLWLLPAAVIVAGLWRGGDGWIALGIGLAAGLSLSGSI